MDDETNFRKGDASMTSQRLVFFDTTLSKNAGRRALPHRLREPGLTPDTAELDAAYRSFIELADRERSSFDLNFLAPAPGGKIQTNQPQTLVKF
jgi:hypothetical protein